VRYGVSLDEDRSDTPTGGLRVILAELLYAAGYGTDHERPLNLLNQRSACAGRALVG
jgi:hypothetical protein